MSRRTARCALSLSEPATCGRVGRGRKIIARLPDAAAIGRATSPSRRTARRCTSPSAPDQRRRRHDAGPPAGLEALGRGARRSAPPGARGGPRRRARASIPRAGRRARLRHRACATARRSTIQPGTGGAVVRRQRARRARRRPAAGLRDRGRRRRVLRLALVSTSATTRTRATRASGPDLAGQASPCPTC